MKNDGNMCGYIPCPFNTVVFYFDFKEWKYIFIWIQTLLLLLWETQNITNWKYYTVLMGAYIAKNKNKNKKGVNGLEWEYLIYNLEHQEPLRFEE